MKNNNFTNKKTSLDTKINLGTPEQKLHEDIFGSGFIKTEEPFKAKEVPVANTLVITKIKNNKVNEQKERIFVCIVEQTHTTGTIDDISDWLDANEYTEDDNIITIYELSKLNEVRFTVERKSKITIKD